MMSYLNSAVHGLDSLCEGKRAGLRSQSCNPCSGSIAVPLGTRHLLPAFSFLNCYMGIKHAQFFSKGYLQDQVEHVDAFSECMEHYTFGQDFYLNVQAW